ncbi:MAG TPA: hypothetical protein VM074_12450 [Solimonas sp.]|nr:hypothetical protein [Solimonas sp.]
MSKCEVCGNDYRRSFEVLKDGKRHTFDSFECAIHLLAPRCEHCDCMVIGHGVEAGERIYCCAHCARSAGAKGLVDHAPAQAGKLADAPA